MKKLVYFLIIIVSLTSCSEEDFLDIQPKGELIPESLEEYDLLLNSFELQNRFHFLYTLDPFFVAPDLESKSEQVQKSYQFKDFIFETDVNDSYWQQNYSAIFNVNIVIDEVTKLEDSSEKNRLLADAKTQRAYYYFNLINYYSKAYNESTASSDLGVIIYTTPDLETTFPRSSVQEVYDLMVEDLVFAIPFLQNRNANPVRSTKVSAYGLLSKVYLYMGSNYATKSVEAANNAISINLANNKGADLYDYNTELPPLPFDNKELILTKSNIFGLFDFFLNPKQFSPAFGNLFETDDLRLKKLYSKGSIFSPSPFYRPKAAFYGKGITTPELYLNRAEANFMLGNNSDVWDDINYIRSHRIDAASYVALSGSNVWDVLRNERTIELAQFDQNFFDLKRWTATGVVTEDYVRHKWTGDGTMLEEAHRLKPGDENWALAVPQDIIINYNSKLEQNPRDGNN